MANPTVLIVRGQSFPTGEASLSDLLDNLYGSAQGQFLERSTLGWRTIAMPHFAVRPLVGTASTSGGGLLAFTPAEGLPIVVTRVTLAVTTKSTGAATLDIGVATNGTTAADNLIDGADIGTNSAVAFDNITDISTNGTSRQYMSGTQSLTVTGLADSSGFIGALCIEFLKL